jgi:hypothetical protein
VLNCPEFEKNGTCSRGRRCPLKHRRKSTKSSVKGLQSALWSTQNRTKSTEPSAEAEEETVTRYWSTNAPASSEQMKIIPAGNAESKTGARQAA